VATVYAGTDAYVAHMRPVKAAVRAKRDEVAAAARANLAAHRETGNHRIRTAMEDTDGLVILEGRNPISVEYGRGGYTRADGRYVGPMDGLQILGRAAGL
jgi:hypothetical protein